MIHGTAARTAIVGQLALIVAGCTQMGNNVPAASGTTAQANGVTAEQAAAGWRSLLDPTLSQWRGYKQQTVPSGWSFANGVLTKTGSAEDLVSKDQFGNFELAFDWKLPPGGNAGVFYRGTEEYDHIYWSAPEYQLLDDARHPDGKSRLTSAGADYAVYPSPAGVVKPADEWNSSLIVVNGNRVQHWLNGQKLLEYELGSPDWEAKVKASKFVAYPNYGRASRGYIGLQGDHDGTLQLRDVRIREIK
jgi:3-keto-disaccharide hydrolase